MSAFAPSSRPLIQLKEEIHALWVHWKCFTADAQTLITITLRKFSKTYENQLDKDTILLLQQLISQRQQSETVLDIDASRNAAFAFFTMLKLSTLKEYMKSAAFDTFLSNKDQTKQYDLRKFQPINALLPSLKHYSIMSKCYAQRLPYQQDPKQSVFYQAPRLFRRGQELWQYQGKSFTASNKGVLLLTVQGVHIAAGRGMAISNGSSIEWWIRKLKEKSSGDNYRGIIGEQQIMEEQIKQGQVKQKQKIIRPDNFPTELHLQFKFIGHEGNITSLSLSNDQFFLLSAATDKTIKLWCLRTKILLLNFKSHSNIIWSVKFSDSGYFFASSSADKTVKLWKTDNSSPIRVMLGHNSDVYKVQFMKNPDYLISCSADKTVRIWEIEKGENIRIIRFDKQVISFTLSFSGRYIVTNQNNGVMTLFDFIRGQQVNTFNLFYLRKSRQQTDKSEKQQRYPIHDMTFSPDQQSFACISKKQIAIYSMQALKQKISTDIYQQIKGQKNTNKQKQFYVKPRQVLDLGTQMNLLFCKYVTKDYLVVAGKK